MRYALLIGCEYTDYAARGLDERLPGCHADIGNFMALLQHVYKYEPANIRILADDPYLSTTPPTAANIRAELERTLTVLEERKITHLTLCYSGHGTQVKDQNNDESDKHDEAIVPTDYKTAGFITDDYLYESFLKRIPQTVHQVTVIMDSCNSGTVLDLPYRYSGGDNVERASLRAEFPFNPQTLIVSLSGCADPQTSASAYNLERSNKWQGAMSWALQQTLKDTQFKPLPCNTLVDQVRSKLRANSFTQTPQFALSRECKPSSITTLF